VPSLRRAASYERATMMVRSDRFTSDLRRPRSSPLRIPVSGRREQGTPCGVEGDEQTTDLLGAKVLGRLRWHRSPVHARSRVGPVHFAHA
jgi:hypothetical protein